MFQNGTEIGYINLWVEMYEAQTKTTKKKVQPKIWDISSMPAQDFELRIIVWETYDVPNNDPEDMSDIFVKVSMNSLDNELTATTDTHIRSSTGFVRIFLFSIFTLNMFFCIFTLQTFIYFFAKFICKYTVIVS